MADLGKDEKFNGEEEEGKRLIEGVTVLDFDVLCSTVAMQSHGKWRLLDNEEEEEEGESGEFGVGVLRMWEGEVLDCFDDRRIAIESVCCPCYRFGKNMRRAGLGPCFIQGTIYFLLAVSAFLNCVAFIITRRRCFLYLAVAFAVSVGMYLGFFRTQTRKKFNIRESRTLEMNNVQGGTWHGRGDTICIGTVNGSGKAFVELHPPPPISACFLQPNTMPKVEVAVNRKC